VNTKKSNYFFDGRLYQKNSMDSMQVAASFDGNNSKQKEVLGNATQNSNSQLLNTAFISDSLKSSFYTGKLTTAFYHHGFYNTEVHRLTDWSILYELVFGETNVDKLRSRS